jgi:murein DD-endopeptidase MepM/ murein hydrolase activator NlpD
MAFIFYEKLFARMAALRASDLDADGNVVHGYVLGERPIKMYFQGMTIPDSIVGGVDCSGSTLSAVYLEWQELKGQNFAQAGSERLPAAFYEYFVPYATLDGEAGFRESSAGAVHTYLEATVGDGGSYNVIAERRNLRRGDLAQIWWNGNASTLTTAQRMKGHSVFIHDRLVDDQGRVWFQVLSSQNPNHKDTDGIGIAGSGKKKYSADAATQKELYEAGKWYRYEENGSGSGVIPELFVARFRRPFPCWPASLDEPAPEIGPVVAPPEAARWHAQIESSRRGGYFPLGLNRTWHGGAHLRPGKGKPVYAVADGVIVAARCPEVDGALDAARKRRPAESFPSRGFALVRHQLRIDSKPRVFYSLYLHLDGDLADPDLAKVRWLWQTRATPGNNLSVDPGARVRLDGGDVVPLAHPIGAGEVVGFTAEDDVHVEIFAEEDIVDGSYPEKQLVEDTDADLFIDQKKFLDFLDEKLDLRNKIEDTWWGGVRVKQDGMITADEVRLFFQLGQEQDRRKVRGMVCKHLSEWSAKVEWPKLAELAGWGYLADDSRKQLIDACKLYAWLDDDLARHCKLPASHVLYHYHPITFLAWLRGRVLDAKAEGVVQEVVPFLAGAGARADVPDRVLWYVDDDATGKDGKRLEALALFGGSESAPDSKKLLVTDADPPQPRKEEGPWEEQADWTSSDGTQHFVRVSAAGEPPEWICVKWGAAVYAERRGSAA